MRRETEATSGRIAPAARAEYHSAKLLALALVGLLTVSGHAFSTCPGLGPRDGHAGLAIHGERRPVQFNVVSEPDPADISRDRSYFLSWWSPGQYLIPGALTLTGLRPGPALTLTTGISLWCCLMGWICVARRFAFSPLAAALLIVFMASFRYSTRSFQTYNGREILLQGVTPWLILAGCRVPEATAVQAACLACLVSQPRHGGWCDRRDGGLWIVVRHVVIPRVDSGEQRDRMVFQARNCLVCPVRALGCGGLLEGRAGVAPAWTPRRTPRSSMVSSTHSSVRDSDCGGWRRCAGGSRAQPAARGELIAITICFYAVFSLAGGN